AVRLVEELVTMIRRGTEMGDGEVDEHSVTESAKMLRTDPRTSPAELLSQAILTSRGRSIRPKTAGQKDYVDAIDENTIVFGIGPAGTGKTYLAMAKAVQALQRKEVTRIILTRPAVEAGEMMDPELLPKLLATGTIEVAPLAYMRGRTLNEAFIVLDEAQNTTPE